MGDNRDNSNDSRFFGDVSKNLIYGKPKAIYFNLKKGKIDTKRIKKL
jgi:type IV secretory pathway protease TraF